jgi:HlyD family secretion protein
MVSPEQAVFALALIDPIWARVFVDEPNLGRISEGMRAAITTDSYPGKRYPGWVGFISPVAEFTPKTVETPEIRTDLVYQARIYVCNPENELRLGMPVTAHIPFDQPTEPLTKATACPAK